MINKKYKADKMLLVIAVLFILYIVIDPSSSLQERTCNKDKKTIYKGAVLRIWSGKGERYIRLANGDLIYPWCQELIRDKVEVGDSLYKPKGTFDMYIYKKSNPDSVIFIPCDFDCDFYNKFEDTNKD